MKKRLSKKAIAGIALLGTAALTGSVFAGWLIVDSNANGKGDGNVTVYDVTDKSLSVKNIQFEYDDISQNSGNVIFGKPTTETTSSFDASNLWFTMSEDMETESFPNKFVFDVFAGKDMKTAPTVKVTFKVEDKAAEYKACIENKLILGPEVAENGEKELTPAKDPVQTGSDGEKKQYSYECDLNFGWGEHFNKQNPYNFYNDKDRNSLTSDSKVTYEDDLNSSFATLYSLNEAKYTITIEATANND